ncbi:16S rRNA (adenine(1518)-N(6)/adenine(1519)-N(6))-dimethyltransferaseRsmA [Oligella ureolytica]|nr:16S rRNA (adenine(1518)-N(6)/adenine(1519)-N(6))-dimethyltransferase RsmA [Alcaligenaceae bacterium]
MAHQARKRFGQNFLIDNYVIGEIVRAINPQENDLMVEIGPGQLALTKPLLEHLKQLTVIEIDRDLVQRLEQTYSAERLRVVEGDALKVNFSEIFGLNNTERKLRVVGNLPYNISTPILFHLMDYADQIVDHHFMLQKEVVMRMVAEPGTKDYGRLSVMLQQRYSMQALFEVGPDAFDPPPRVDSAIVRMIPLGDDRLKPQSYPLFSSVVAQAFSQRRKMIRRSLNQWEFDFSALGIEETARAEDLSLAQFIALADMANSKN